MALVSKWTALIVLLLGLAVALAVGAAALVVAPQKTRSAPKHGGAGGVISVDPSYGFEVADKKRLVGHGTHVFVGRVIEQVGTVGLPTSGPNHAMPQTQFKVEVLENIKGQLTGTVTVNQLGGYREETLVLIANDPLLEPGQTYLFVTGPRREKGWYSITAEGHSDIRITDEAHRAALVREFAEAHKQEIPYDPKNPGKGKP